MGLQAIIPLRVWRRGSTLTRATDSIRLVMTRAGGTEPVALRVGPVLLLISAGHYEGELYV